MSWLRTAVNKAVEVGNNHNITRAVKNYADTVVQQAGHAVAEGAKILQDRIATRNIKSAKQTIKRLEEAAVSCNAAERSMLLARWLIVLKEVDRLSLGSIEDEKRNLEQLLAADDAKKASLVLYYDSDVGGETLNFRDVFLQSQALEGITLSMILEPPKDEEISLLLELFGLCLTGGKEVHNAIVSSIQDLGTTFSSYNDEVLVKREELLQFAQGAITGLKINAELVRIDTESAALKKQLDTMSPSFKPSDDGGQDKASKETTLTAIEGLKKELAQVRVCSKLEALLLKKKHLSSGDSAVAHAQKVDKLKVLLESLANSTSKAENRISDQRSQKEEALKVRLTKASETNEKEKELSAEIAQFEKQRDELEAELKKVNISLAAAQARLRNAREERDQFDEANNQIIAHLKTKEDDMLKSIASCKVEAEVINTWLNFLEDTWLLQCSYTETKDKQAIEELERHEDYFSNLAISRLSAYKKDLKPWIDRIGKFVDNLKNLSGGSELASEADTEDSKVLNPRKNLEEEYLDFEAKIITTFSVVDNMKEQFYAQRDTIPRKDDPKVKELFDDIEKLREEFESIERPVLEIETPSPKAHGSSPLSPKADASSPLSPISDTAPVFSPNTNTTKALDDISQALSQKANSPLSQKQLESATRPFSSETAQKSGTSEHPEASAVAVEQVLDTEAELAKLESEFGNVNHDYSTDDIGEWEFDELEKEFRSGDSGSFK